jgi:CRISPR-associated endonuclease/helicase Cas3
MSVETDFRALTGFAPLSWQKRLYREHFASGAIPLAVDVPTGLGKTSVMALWLIARAHGPPLPCRLVYVVDRRAVVDQATAEAEKLRNALEGEGGHFDKLELPARDKVREAAAALKERLGLRGRKLSISTLRGRCVDNQEWRSDPAAPAIIVGTVDMIGSRLLFSGYGVSPKMRPYHAGLFGADTLVVLDEAHLVPPFEALLESIDGGGESFGPRMDAAPGFLPRLRLLSLSATGRERAGNVFRLAAEDREDAVVKQRLGAKKRLSLHELDAAKSFVGAMAERAWRLATEAGPSRVLIYCSSREDALKVKDEIDSRAKREKIKHAAELLVGERRVHERDLLLGWLKDNGFVGDERRGAEVPTFLIATSAGEVGVDLDADHMVCDLVEWERMVQRLGRVNRRGGEGRSATVEIVAAPPRKDRKDGEEWKDRLARLRKPVDALKGDGSPAAIVALKADPAQKEALQAAQTQPPLWPALTRAVVDAWSMTSLDEHTGRPEIDPWLRGWVEEEEPQTTLVWRRWLPWRNGADAPIEWDIEEFFDSARVHLDETLEVPVWRVLDWLKARVVDQKARLGGESPLLGGDSPVLIALDRKGKLARGFLLKELAVLTQLKGKDRERAEADLVGRTLVVSSALGGLNKDGMLSDDWREPANALDNGWSEEVLRDRIGYRVVGPGDPEPGPAIWRRDAAILLAEPQDSEDEEDREELRVYVARGRAADHEGDPAVARRCQLLDAHHEMAAEAAGKIAAALNLPEPYRIMLEWVARHHDLGKDRHLWRGAMGAPPTGPAYAKTERGDGRRLNGYRHEFGSLGDVERTGALAEIEHLGSDICDLALHLIASHHGYGRPVIKVKDPDAPPSALEERAREVALRFARLQRRWGPWGLAWWEALLRAADVQASRRNDAGENAGTADGVSPSDERGAYATAEE